MTLQPLHYTLEETIKRYKNKYEDKEKVLRLATYAGQLEYPVVLASENNLKRTLKEVHSHTANNKLKDTLDVIYKAWYLKSQHLIKDEHYTTVAVTTSLLKLPDAPEIPLITIKTHLQNEPIFLFLFLLYYGIYS